MEQERKGEGGKEGRREAGREVGRYGGREGWMDGGEERKEGKDCVITDTTHTCAYSHSTYVRTLPNLTLSPLTSMGSVLKRQMDHSIPDV